MTITKEQRTEYLLALRVYFEYGDLLALLGSLWAYGARGNQHAQQRVEQILDILIRYRRDHQIFKEMRLE
jgi:hypothetical protein